VLRWIAEEVDLAARSDAKILLTGESGVGKDVIARLIHRRSARASRAYVAINCAGVPDSLLESELFGHVRGSFTGAYRDKVGLLEQADGGTVFMDEVGEMSLRMQATLLRFLEDGVIHRVGADRNSGTVNVRVIAATNRVLAERVAAKEFREDLYYRLNVIHLLIPPLRERREDIIPLFEHFVQLYSEKYGFNGPQLAPELLTRITEYNWPGNVRELRNVVERIIVRTRGEVALRAEHLPKEFSVRAAIAAVDGGAQASVAPSKAAAIMQRIVSGDESFWSAVYAPFMARDLTREHVRMIITMGLQQTRGNYKMLLPLFNMAPTDYKRLLTFLRKYQCHVSFQQFRSERPAAAAAPADVHRVTPPLVA
jgi:transcriptional regulator with PAS, ATPase and Fis domain